MFITDPFLGANFQLSGITFYFNGLEVSNRMIILLYTPKIWSYLYPLYDSLVSFDEVYRLQSILIEVYNFLATTESE